MKGRLHLQVKNKIGVNPRSEPLEEGWIKMRAWSPGFGLRARASLCKDCWACLGLRSLGCISSVSP